MRETEMQAKAQEEQQKQMEQQFGKNRKEGETFLEENKAKEGVTVLESGLQYQVLKKGSGESPKPTSTVKVHYEGKLLNGKVFDSSIERGEPTQFGVSQVIRGWTEALLLMKPGDKWKLFIPQELAYGASPPRGSQILPFSVLVFEVELLEVLN